MTRRGVHRLECGCGAVIYSTVPNLERHGLPACPCGRPFVPESVELAEHLGVSDCDAVREFQAEMARVWHGQAPHAHKGRDMRDPSAIAFERVESRRREMARNRRLAALKPAAEALPF